MDSSISSLLERTRARDLKLRSKLSSENVRPTPLLENNQVRTPPSPKKSQIDITSPSKTLKPYRMDVSPSKSRDSKENVDVAVEINILTGHNCQVEVQVEEQEIEEGESFESALKRMVGKSTTALVKAFSKPSHSDSCDDSAENECSEHADELPVMRETTKSRLKKLGLLYSGDPGALSSPIHSTESKFHENLSSAGSSAVPAEHGVNKMRGPRLERFAALAETINHWEDDMGHTPSVKKDEHKSTPATSRKQWRAPSPPKQNITETTPTSTKICTSSTSPSKSIVAVRSLSKESVTNGDASEATAVHRSSSKEGMNQSPTRSAQSPTRSAQSPTRSGQSPTKVVPASPTKQLKWDQNVLANLESQGYKRTECTSRLVYDYADSINTNSDKKDTPCKSMASVQESPKQLNQINKKASLKKSRAPDVPKSSSDVDSLPKSPKKKLFNVEKASEIHEVESKSVMNVANSPKTGIKSSVLTKAAMFEAGSPRPREKDPAEMSLQERLALFEKNKGSALVPKSAFGIAAGSKKMESKDKKPGPLPSAPSLSLIDSKTSSVATCQGGIKNKVAALFGRNQTISQTQIEQEVRAQREKEMDVLLNRFNKHKEVIDTNSEAESSTQVLNRSPMPPPPPPKMPDTEYESPSASKRKSASKGDSPEVYAALEDVKRIRVVQPHAGGLYPALSDLEEASHSSDGNLDTSQSNIDSRDQSSQDYDSDEMDNDTSSGLGDCSLGREILEAVHNTPVAGNRPKTRAEILNESTASDISDVLDDMDGYLDEALDSPVSQGSVPRKRGRSISPEKSEISASFSYKRGPAQTPLKPHKLDIDTVDSPTRTAEDYDNRQEYKSPLPKYLQDSEKPVLMHTVSFYRKQQTQVNKSPVKQISRAIETSVSTTEDEDKEDDPELVAERIKQLMDEVYRQQTIISQTSQALNLCEATVEFSGSSEQVDGEKHLLVATHRRQAALHEVQRLRVEGFTKPSGNASERGCLHMSNITLPLKAEYQRALSKDSHPGHHLVCLVKHQDRVLVTNMICTLPGLYCMAFPDVMRLEDLYADFKITVEVYGMEAQRQVLPHEVKYHIGLKKSSKMTPMKTLKGDSRLARTPIQSPAGPHAVRSSQLLPMGYMIFSLRDRQKQQWTLNKVPANSPLEGNIQIKLDCKPSDSVRYQGFLTMFQDISGFGAWHRRWCSLNGSMLSYWKYPDDENNKKAPIGTIDITDCTSKVVGIVRRDICARLNTFLLEFVRPAEDSDTNSLILLRDGQNTIVRHLLSADSLEERVAWCSCLNRALAVLRTWGAPSKH